MLKVYYEDYYNPMHMHKHTLTQALTHMQFAFHGKLPESKSSLISMNQLL